MSGDAAGKKRGDDPSYVTIPPELRELVPPKGVQKELLAQSAKNPRLVASVAALRELNGGANADPLFFDTRGVATALERIEDGDEAKGAGNAKVHVPAFAMPTANAAAATSNAAEDAEITVEKIAVVEKAASPWATEAVVAPIASSDLPSALAPVARTEPAPASEKAAGVAPKDDRLVRGLIALVVLAVLGFAAFQLIPREKTKDPAVVVPAPSGTASVAPAVPAPELSATAPTVTAPVNSVEIDAGVPPTSGSAGVLAPVKVKSAGGPEENLYDAAAPSPAKTVEAVVAPPSPTTVPVAPPKPSATTPGTAPDEEIFSRPKKKPEEGAQSK
jgi:hypothetical protein